VAGRSAARCPGLPSGLALAVRAPGRQWLRGQGRVPVRVEDLTDVRARVKSRAPGAQPGSIGPPRGEAWL